MVSYVKRNACRTKGEAVRYVERLIMVGLFSVSNAAMVSAGVGGGFQMAIPHDGFSVSAVPEPASLALLVVGAGGILVLRRWRRK